MYYHVNIFYYFTEIKKNQQQCFGYDLSFDIYFGFDFAPFFNWAVTFLISISSHSTGMFPNVIFC